jgi:cell wall-associated NlpC family hydrolase
MTPEQAAAVILEAQGWLNTKYHSHGRLKAVGVDCAMLLLEVYSNAGIVPRFDPGAYPEQFGLHRSEELFKGFVERYAVQMPEPVAGGCVLFKFGRCYSHGGIMISKTRLIHAVMREGRVAYGDLTDADLVNREPLFYTIKG